MAGLTATGFVVKTLTEIREGINAELHQEIDPSLDLSDESPEGKLVGIIANTASELWELAEAVYNAFDRNAATGSALEALVALTGTLRQPATSSTVTLTLIGTPGTIVPAGSSASVDNTNELFSLNAAATIVTVVSWLAATPYSVGDRVTNNSNVYECTIAGTSAGSGGPTTEDTAIVDNTVTWTYLGDGTGAIDTAASSDNTGPVVALSGTISTIQNPVGGWNNVTNREDADLGTNVDSDAELRLRQIEELSRPGDGPLNAIRTDLAAVSGVTAVRVFMNITDVTDADGLPPHSVEALVSGGADQDIFDALLASVDAGIATHGTTTGTSTDAEGIAQNMAFTRPTEINIWVEVDVTKDPATYPADGDTQITNLIAAQNTFTGLDVVASRISALAFSVAGVLDVTEVRIGLSDPPTLSVTLPIELRELADYDSSRVTVTSVDGTP